MLEKFLNVMAPIALSHVTCYSVISFGTDREDAFHTKSIYQCVNYLHCKLSAWIESFPSVARHLAVLY